MRDTAHCYMCKRYKHKGDFYGDVSRKSGVSSRCIKYEARRTIQRELDGEWERRYEMRRDRRRGFGITNYGTGYSVEKVPTRKIDRDKPNVFVQLDTVISPSEWFELRPILASRRIRYKAYGTELSGRRLRVKERDRRETVRFLRHIRAAKKDKRMRKAWDAFG